MGSLENRIRRLELWGDCPECGDFDVEIIWDDGWSYDPEPVFIGGGEEEVEYCNTCQQPLTIVLSWDNGFPKSLFDIHRSDRLRRRELQSPEDGF